MGTKLVELFANRVDERRNMINDYLRRELALRVLGGVDFRGSVDFEFLPLLELSCSSELFLALLYHFAWFYHFLCHLLVFAILLLLDDLLDFLGLLAVLHGVLDLNFKLCAFIINGLI
jgi:hypothetical protein